MRLCEWLRCTAKMWWVTAFPKMAIQRHINSPTSEKYLRTKRLNSPEVGRQPWKDQAQYFVFCPIDLLNHRISLFLCEECAILAFKAERNIQSTLPHDQPPYTGPRMTILETVLRPLIKSQEFIVAFKDAVKRTNLQSPFAISTTPLVQSLFKLNPSPIRKLIPILEAGNYGRPPRTTLLQFIVVLFHGLGDL